MSIATIKKALKPINYHYAYKVNHEDKTVKEYKVYDYEKEPEDLSLDFPYAECGYEDPYGLICSSEWSCYSYDCKLINDIDEDY